MSKTGLARQPDSTYMTDVLVWCTIGSMESLVYDRGEEAHRNPFSVDIVDVIECANVN